MRAEALAQRRIEALARREHQAAREAADGIAAREQRHPAPLLELQDAERVVVERVGIDLEQLVARIGVEDREQRLAVMAVGIQSGAAQHLLDPVAQQRHVEHRRVIGGRGEEAGEAPLAGGSAVRIERLHDDAVHRPAAMDQRVPIGLDDQQRLRPAREPRHRLAAAQPRLEQLDLVAAQDAERRPRHHLVADAAGLRGVLDVAVAAMAEEGEVIGLEPAQEFLFLVVAGGCQVLDRVDRCLPHRLPVADGEPHFGQHAGQRRGEIVALGRIGLAVDLDLHQRFGRRALVGIGELEEVAIEVAPHRHHRMGQQMDARSRGGSARW